MKLKPNAPFRMVREIGRGDFVKVGNEWKEVALNTAFGETPIPASWEVIATDGARHSSISITGFAKREDFE